jgi:hypothetical protein
VGLFDWFRNPSSGRVEVDGAVIEYERGIRELANVRYRGAEGRFDFDAEWLGWGRGQQFHLSIVIPLEVPSGTARIVADRIRSGLGKLRILCVVEQWEESIPIPTHECEQGLAEFSAWMRSMGREVTIDKEAMTIGERWIPGSGNRFAEHLKKHPAEHARRLSEAASCLRGYRHSRRLLAKSEKLKLPG